MSTEERKSEKEEVVQLLKNYTRPSCVLIPHDTVERLKEICKRSDDLLVAAFNQLLEALSDKHPQTRLLALLLMDVLYSRSKLFRKRCTVLLPELFQLTLISVPAPVPTREYLKDEALRLLEKWQHAFGRKYPYLTQGCRHLKRKGFKFPKIAEKEAQAAKRRNQKDMEQLSTAANLYDHMVRNLADTAKKVSEIVLCANQLISKATSLTNTTSVPVPSYRKIRKIKKRKINEVVFQRPRTKPRLGQNRSQLPSRAKKRRPKVKVEPSRVSLSRLKDKPSCIRSKPKAKCKSTKLPAEEEKRKSTVDLCDDEELFSDFSSDSGGGDIEWVVPEPLSLEEKKRNQELEEAKATLLELEESESSGDEVWVSHSVQEVDGDRTQQNHSPSSSLPSSSVSAAVSLSFDIQQLGSKEEDRISKLREYRAKLEKGFLPTLVKWKSALIKLRKNPMRVGIEDSEVNYLILVLAQMQQDYRRIVAQCDALSLQTTTSEETTRGNKVRRTPRLPRKIVQVVYQDQPLAVKYKRLKQLSTAPARKHPQYGKFRQKYKLGVKRRRTR